ncbi:MAG: M56 family metallopeptidase [Pseudoxanthomonas sp.]
MSLEFVSEILLPRLFAASVQSILFVAVVWTLCQLLPRLSASARAVLWWLVALQLVVGVLWSSPLALPLLPAEVVQASHAPLSMTVQPSVSAGTLASPLPSASPYVALAQASSWSWSEILAWMWLLGLSLMIARTVSGYLATRRLLRESLACKDRNLLHALQLAAEAHGLGGAPHLRLSAAIDSPQLIGPLRPVLLLPANHLQSMHPDELDMALTHELVHLQRRDLWWGLLPATAQHLFFFHPLAHLAAHEYALAREAACDAAVLAGNRHCARDYGRLLVRLGVAPRPSAGLASASPTFRILKRRLVMLQNTASTPRAVAVVITLAVAALGVLPYRIVAAPARVEATPTSPVAPLAPLNTAAPVAPLGGVESVTPVAPISAIDAASGFPAPPARVPEPPPPAAPAPPMPAPPAPPPTAPTPDLPVPPAPPAPAAPLTTRGMFNLSAREGQQAYVFVKGDHSIAEGTTEDIRKANRLRSGNEELLWIRRDGREYVVRDPATLERFRASYAEAMSLGDAQAAIGNRHAAIGSKQAAIGERQAQLGMKQAELASLRMQESEADARMAELDRQQAALDQEQAKLNAPMAELDRQQEALSKKMEAANARAERETRKLMEEAIRNGTAKPLNKG